MSTAIYSIEVDFQEGYALIRHTDRMRELLYPVNEASMNFNKNSNINLNNEDGAVILSTIILSSSKLTALTFGSVSNISEVSKVNKDAFQ